MGDIADRVAEMILAGAKGREIIAEIAKMEAAPAVKVPPEFIEFWAMYPRKDAKPAAIKAYRAALKRKAKHADIMAGLARFVATRPDPQYTPHGSTWLNQDRWNDVPAPKAMTPVEAAKERLRQKIENEHRSSREGTSGDQRSVGLRLEHGNGAGADRQLSFIPR